jgi:hypothetical protein
MEGNRIKSPNFRRRWKSEPHEGFMKPKLVLEMEKWLHEGFMKPKLVMKKEKWFS